MSSSPRESSPGFFGGRREWLGFGGLVLFVLIVGVVYLQFLHKGEEEKPRLTVSAPSGTRARGIMEIGGPDPRWQVLVRKTGTAVGALGQRHPLAALAVLVTLPPDGVPVGMEVDPNRPWAPPIDAEVLAGIEDKAPIRNADENLFEAEAYNYVLVQANRLSREAFAQSARRNVTFAHLFEEPSDYRGQVIHVEGQLRMLRKFKPPRLAANEGVKDLYEAWIFDAVHDRYPYCVVFTELPEGLTPSERMNHHVKFDGYFFKRYRYQAGDGWRDAPLLIGHTVALYDPPAVAEADSPLYGAFLPIFLGGLAATIMLAAGLTSWFRRGDRRVRSALARATLPSFPGLGIAEGSGNPGGISDQHH
jgi:hypothetical protein